MQETRAKELESAPEMWPGGRVLISEYAQAGGRPGRGDGRSRTSGPSSIHPGEWISDGGYFLSSRDTCGTLPGPEPSALAASARVSSAYPFTNPKKRGLRATIRSRSG